MNVKFAKYERNNVIIHHAMKDIKQEEISNKPEKHERMNDCKYKCVYHLINT